jgi:hypothetical protein
MRKLYALTLSGKNNRMIANHVTTAQCGESNFPFRPRAGMTVAHRLFDISKRNIAALGRRFAKTDRRP